MATICAKSSYRAVATRCCWSPAAPTGMELVTRKPAGFLVSVQLSQLGAGNRQKTRCAYQCEIVPWWVLSGLAPLPLADEGSVGYRAASHRGADEDAVLGMWIAGRDGATRAHRPALSPVPLPGLWQAVQ